MHQENCFRGAFERVRGTIEENINYCKKDNRFIAFGKSPNTTKEGIEFSQSIVFTDKDEFAAIRSCYPAL